MTGIEGETAVLGLIAASITPWVLIATGKIRTPSRERRATAVQGARHTPAATVSEPAAGQLTAVTQFRASNGRFAAADGRPRRPRRAAVPAGSAQ